MKTTNKYFESFKTLVFFRKLCIVLFIFGKIEFEVVVVVVTKILHYIEDLYRYNKPATFLWSLPQLEKIWPWPDLILPASQQTGLQ